MDDKSRHYKRDRKERENLIKKIGIGNVVDSFVVDRGHVNGKEIHTVTDTGIIIIHNEKTGKLITQLIGRPEQLRRLYSLKEKKVPRNILTKAYLNNRLGYNKI